jgi:hypothetical protein
VVSERHLALLVTQITTRSEESGPLIAVVGVASWQWTAAMAHRQFNDSAGVTWRVWENDPTAFPADWEDRAAQLHAEFLGGWLTFASSSETRRVAPVPLGWEELSAEKLEMLCRGGKRTRESGDGTGRSSDAPRSG